MHVTHNTFSIISNWTHCIWHESIEMWMKMKLRFAVYTFFPDFLHVFTYIKPRSFAPCAIWFTLATPYTYIWIMVIKYYTEPLNILQCLYNNFTTWAIHLYENIDLIRLNVWRRGLTITFSLLVVPEVVRCRKKWDICMLVYAHSFYSVCCLIYQVPYLKAFIYCFDDFITWFDASHSWHDKHCELSRSRYHPWRSYHKFSH